MFFILFFPALFSAHKFSTISPLGRQQIQLHLSSVPEFLSLSLHTSTAIGRGGSDFCPFSFYSTNNAAALISSSSLSKQPCASACTPPSGPNGGGMPLPAPAACLANRAPLSSGNQVARKNLGRASSLFVRNAQTRRSRRTWWAHCGPSGREGPHTRRSKKLRLAHGTCRRTHVPTRSFLGYPPLSLEMYLPFSSATIVPRGRARTLDFDRRQTLT
ncbi:uncharacterized protein LY79DRAFT_100907 [Colletotrichum navitas]|uniref:Uncharacterized protein n=1 Tax=Colletotrichum navitas TaxID=681940 RepID=A0AAD8Q5K4_9PEZI|nr:uncharacterized protein LY79DRAFT_100907 [Colletotrichum navitas]KAK1595527.1 hypothetical protein LY79DRAFT_100907 [Colletotrichum navitas]